MDLSLIRNLPEAEKPKTLREVFEKMSELTGSHFPEVLDILRKPRAEYDIGLKGENAALYFACVMREFLDDGTVMASVEEKPTYFLRFKHGPKFCDLWIGSGEEFEPMIAEYAGTRFIDAHPVPISRYDAESLARAADIAERTGSTSTADRLRQLSRGTQQAKLNIH